MSEIPLYMAGMSVLIKRLARLRFQCVEGNDEPTVRHSWPVSSLADLRLLLINLETPPSKSKASTSTTSIDAPLAL